MTKLRLISLTLITFTFCCIRPSDSVAGHMTLDGLRKGDWDNCAVVVAQVRAMPKTKDTITFTLDVEAVGYAKAMVPTKLEVQFAPEELGIAFVRAGPVDIGDHLLMFIRYENGKWKMTDTSFAFMPNLATMCKVSGPNDEVVKKAMEKIYKTIDENEKQQAGR